MTKKVQYMAQDCHETNKVDRVLSDGKVQYRVACHDIGMKWTDEGPLPVLAQTSYTDGVKVGRMIRFDDSMGSQSIPLVIFGDKQGKKLIGVATFLLE